jgi:hypothetical protein
LIGLFSLQLRGSKRDITTIFNPNSHCRNRRRACIARNIVAVGVGFFSAGLMIK